MIAPGASWRARRVCLFGCWSSAATVAAPGGVRLPALGQLDDRPTVDVVDHSFRRRGGLGLGIASATNRSSENSRCDCDSCGMAEPSEDPRSELGRARRDPRLGHGRAAVVADWRSAMESAERVRRLADWGLYVLQGAEDLERVRLDASNADPDYAERALHAARERAALAKAESDNQMVELNAMTLVAMVSAADAFVEGLVPAAREMLTRLLVHRAMDEAAHQQPEVVAQLSQEQLDRARRVFETSLATKLGEVDATPRGTGAKRWEEPLAKARLGASASRPIPADMDQALAEVIQLRHVIAHRAGRVDAKALKAAPSLPYVEGELVRVDRAAYKRYSAGLWTYGEKSFIGWGLAHRLWTTGR